MTDERIERLKAVIEKLTERDRKFAESLISQEPKKKGLSEKQWFWVDALTKRVENPEPQKVRELGDLERLFLMFEKAQQTLKWPKIHLMAGDQPVRLQVAGPRSKYHGKVMVTDGERFGQNKWWGAISKDGDWLQPRLGVPAEVEQVVRQMARDPEGTAKAHGKLTGQCCFCNAGLKTEISTVVGYGPRCAKNFGLKWNKTEVRKIRMKRDKGTAWAEAAEEARRKLG